VSKTDKGRARYIHLMIEAEKKIELKKEMVVI
jgi:hypothetical protein